MKALGIVFSSRANGNCSNAIKYCLNKMKNKGYEIETLNIFEYEIQGCGNCNYICFNSGECVKEDDIYKLYNRCFEADKIIFAIPTFCGHLTSQYFKFWERSQSLFKDEEECENIFLKKINLIIIGNLSSGGDMAVHEALYGFINRRFYPEVVLLSSEDYNTSSIKGNLVEFSGIRDRLDNFVEKIVSKS
ncbi:flavodoxin family protein [Tepidimicrobium xylanilyticum]|uniref:NADPH-dependent FMN reductase n=1 Tax=Tepidimicrobium xylanilyticum TaxID=1123352 RepID=A0A1H2QK68_9FIRM|nr:flavodoxin family protein [Tepidimicrobium xylanilyticum]SDW07607.1 NADPH-dependent FMN reductase [Tepidimicrobium xylanilyticum]